MTDPALAVLMEIRDELRQIRSALQTRALPPADHEILRNLLPAIAGKHGSYSWSVAEIVANPALMEISGSLNSRKLGKLFSRSADHNVNGYRLERVRTEHSAQFWRVVQGSL